ncbi:MAG TPA: hypothetical protein VGE97_08775 [Nitrososphaera sp.]|jgi:hypothetical protein
MASVDRGVIDKRKFNTRPLGANSRIPRKPEKVLEIMTLRDIHGLTWRQIGERVGLSHQAPYLVYKRWKERQWAKENIDDT